MLCTGLEVEALIKAVVSQAQQRVRTTCTSPHHRPQSLMATVRNAHVHAVALAREKQHKNKRAGHLNKITPLFTYGGTRRDFFSYIMCSRKTQRNREGAPQPISVTRAELEPIYYSCEPHIPSNTPHEHGGAQRFEVDDCSTHFVPNDV